MRVIAGQAKGRRLYGPDSGCTTRPITDRAKESLFNILGPRLTNARVLDLFAGIGSVGIEALSRGASQAMFIENSRKAVKTLKRNLAHTQLEIDAEVISADVIRFLAGTPASPFEMIFLAPPQYQELWSKTLHLIDITPQWLTSDGLVIVQIDPSEYRRLNLSYLMIHDTRCYSNVMLCFYKRRGGPYSDGAQFEST